MPNDPLSPAESPESSPGPSRSWLRSRRTWLIVAGVIVAVLAADALLRHFLNDTPKPSSTATRYDRPGYPRAELAGSIGDPAALIAKAQSTPAQYQGTPSVQACNVLTMGDLQQQNLRLDANPLSTVIRREYIDGQGQAPVPTNAYTIPSLGVNLCSYQLQGDSGSAEVRLYQPNYLPVSAIDREIRLLYQALPDIEGVKAYRRTKQDQPTVFNYMLRTGDTAAELTLEPATKNPEQTIQALLKTAAKNLAAQAAKPSGPPRFEYNSPLFKKTYANGCQLVTATDIKATFETEADPFVQESLASAIGLINFSDADGASVEHNYIGHHCIRHAAITNYLRRQAVQIDTTSYVSDVPAKADFAYGKQSQEEPTSSTVANVGNEARLSTEGTKSTMSFRQGRFIIKLSLYDPAQKFTQEQATAKLTALAQKIARQLQNS